MVRTDADGRYWLRRQPPGRYRLRFLDPQGRGGVGYWKDSRTFRGSAVLKIRPARTHRLGVQRLSRPARPTVGVTVPSWFRTMDVHAHRAGDNDPSPIPVAALAASEDGSRVTGAMNGLGRGTYRFSFWWHHPFNGSVHTWYDRVRARADATTVRVRPGAATTVEARFPRR